MKEGIKRIYEIAAICFLISDTLDNVIMRTRSLRCGSKNAAQ